MAPPARPGTLKGERIALSNDSGDFVQSLLFLNFEGVLSRAGPGRLIHLPLFEAWCRFQRDLGIVVTAEDRLATSLESLRERFSPDMRSRILGTTPSFDERPRQFEVEQWRKIHRHEGPFVVVDALEAEFEPRWPHLVLCGPLGLRSVELERAGTILKRQRSQARPPRGWETLLGMRRREGQPGRATS